MQNRKGRRGKKDGEKGRRGKKNESQRDKLERKGE